MTALMASSEEAARRRLGGWLGVGTGQPAEISDFDVSDDGRDVVVSGLVYDDHDSAGRGVLCHVHDLGEPRTLAPSTHDLRLPRCGPRQHLVAAAARRPASARSDVVVVDLRETGGAARVVASVSGAVEGLEWSPAGDELLILVAEDGAPAAGASGSARLGAPRRHGPLVLTTLAEGPRRRLFRLDLDDGGLEGVGEARPNVWEAAWCGPHHIVAVISDGAEESDWFDSSLAVLDAHTGLARWQIEGELSFAECRAAPGGKTIAVIEGPASTRTLVPGTVALFDAATGVRRASPEVPFDVTSIAWRDHSRLHLAGLCGLESVVGEFSLEDGAFIEAWRTPRACSTSATRGFPRTRPVAPDGFLAVRSGLVSPPRLSLIGPQGTRTLMAASVRETAPRLRSRRVQARAPDDVRLEGLLLTPEEGARPYPLVVSLHGGPVYRWTDAWLADPIGCLLVEHGYAVLHPNPRGSAGWGADFAQAVRGDMGGADAGDILASIDGLIDQGICDGERLAVMGRSYGGFLTCRLVTKDPRFSAAAALSPVTNWLTQHYASNLSRFDELFLGELGGGPAGTYVSRSPVASAVRVTTPVLLCAGLDDACTPALQAEEFFGALEARGAEAALALYPGEGHGLRRVAARAHEAALVVEWFERHLAAPLRPSAVD